jgi:hypothetical protein
MAPQLNTNWILDPTLHRYVITVVIVNAAATIGTTVAAAATARRSNFSLLSFSLWLNFAME